MPHWWIPAINAILNLILIGMFYYLFRTVQKLEAALGKVSETLSKVAVGGEK